MSSYTVALAPERFAQLKNLAALEGSSLADTLAGFLDEAIAAKRLPDELPGWKVERVGGNVLLTHAASGFAKLVPAAEAKMLGEEFLRFAQPAGRRAATLDLDTMTEIRRQGAGVLIRDANSFVEHTLAANVAADIGRRLIRAAA
ncbi:MAG: hypothetical protein M9939_01630 [Mesorhizobium sp.]|nr:hypothetical protein [Mesorhizobium sp.]MCO5159810.1 hypothetical protein [Mesorhizobium sp.]